MLIKISMFVHLPSEITLEVWWLHLGTHWPPTSPIASSHPSSLYFCLYIFPLLGAWWLPHCLCTCHGKAFDSSCAHITLWTWKTLPLSLYLSLKTCLLHKSPSPWLAIPSCFTYSWCPSSSGPAHASLISSHLLILATWRTSVPGLTWLVPAKSYSIHTQGILILHSAH